MKRRTTRKKLLSAIEQVRQKVTFYPTCEFVVEFDDEDGRFKWGDTRVLYSVDDLLLVLMEKSMFYRMFDISWYTYIRRAQKLICIQIRLTPDKNSKTNIDCEFIEAISKWGYGHDR